MSDHVPHTNRWLIALSVLLCLVFGGIFTHSSAVPSQVSANDEADVFTSEGDSSDTFSESAGTDDNNTFSDTSDTGSSDSSVKDQAESSVIKTSETPSCGPALSLDVSKEASEGVWVSSGSNWMFLVDSKAYTGWLTDTDGKQYYMDEAGLMQTGWTDIGNKRYYFDMDGILQTGTLTIGKKSYELDSDGSLKDYTPEEKSSKDDSSKKKSSDKDSSGKKTSSKNSSDKDSSSQNTDSKKDSDTKKKSASDTDTSQKAVALTFDDGPGSFTGRLLDCLEQNNAKATFFMVGTEIESFPDEVKRMKELGCELGNHTYDHTDLTKLSADEITSEISKVDEKLVELTGQGASVVRPPYGSINDTVKAAVGTPMILWSIDTLDWKTEDVESTIEEVMNNVEDGSIILMHDIYSTSVDAAEILIPQLIEDGYQLVTVHELAAMHNTELSTGIAYGEFHNAG